MEVLIVKAKFSEQAIKIDKMLYKSTGISQSLYFNIIINNKPYL
jgi:hypothetical protein